jgi:SAM-dependent methyltransferase
MVQEPSPEPSFLHNVVMKPIYGWEGELQLNYLDMLTKLGVGNAHPGGYQETLNQLQKYPIKPGSKVLEVGCGTGRTACLLAEQGCRVTALDIRPNMLAKAQIRAERLQVKVQFVEGDACQMPFEEGVFDVVLVESVSNFADTQKAISEYYRVLKTDGIIYDREVIKWKEMPDGVFHELCAFYGVETLLSVEEWKQALSKEGFRDVRHDDKRPFPQHMWGDTVQHPDPVRLADEETLLDPEIWQLSAQYGNLMDQYRDYLGYAVLIGIK